MSHPDDPAQAAADYSRMRLALQQPVVMDARPSIAGIKGVTELLKKCEKSPRCRSAVEKVVKKGADELADVAVEGAMDALKNLEELCGPGTDCFREFSYYEDNPEAIMDRFLGR